MGKTAYWRVIPNVAAVLVHTDQAPTDEDWDAYIKEVTAAANNIKGVLVYTEKAGPSAPQRARSNEAFKQANVDVSTAIMTGSKVVKGIVTALSWAIGSKVKAFSTADFDGAVTYLGLDPEERLTVRVVLKQLARSADVVIEAFADESGQFRRKYS